MQIIDSFRDEFSFLSNFYLCEINYLNYKFNSVESAYQAMKCLNSEDIKKFESLSPKEAKKLGRKIQIRPDWDINKLKIMEDLLRIKFSIPELRSKLISTGNSELIEGNYWKDYFWGICDGIGKNHLGKLLMKIRKELNQQN